jgi:hypothetical protein
MLLRNYTCSFCTHGHRLKGDNYYYIASFFWFFFWLFRHLVNDNSFKIVDFYLIYSGHKLSGLYTQSQILFQHIARPNDNDNVWGVDTTYVYGSFSKNVKIRVIDSIQLNFTKYTFYLLWNMIPDTYRIKKNNKYISMHRTKMKFCAQIPRVISPLIALILIDSLFLFTKSLRL